MINQEHYETWAQAQPAVETDSGEVDYLTWSSQSMDNMEKAFKAYKKAISGTSRDSNTSHSVFIMATLTPEGRVLVAHAYSFGQGKSSDLDRIKLFHSLIQSKNENSVTVSGRFDPTGHEALLALLGIDEVQTNEKTAKFFSDEEQTEEQEDSQESSEDDSQES